MLTNILRVYGEEIRTHLFVKISTENEHIIAISILIVAKDHISDVEWKMRSVEGQRSKGVSGIDEQESTSSSILPSGVWLLTRAISSRAVEDGQ